MDTSPSPNPEPAPTFACPCGNDRRWYALTTGPNGTSGTCKECDRYVDRPDVRTRYQISMGATDNTIIGNGNIQTNAFL